MSKLPTGYTELEYITSGGDQYVDTGVSPTDALIVKTILRPIKVYMSEYAVFGSEWSLFGFFLMFYQNKIRFHSKGSSVDISSFFEDKENTIVCAANSISVNGTNYNLSGTGANSHNSIFIFSVPNEGAFASKRGRFSLYSLEMSVSGEVIRKFVPCKNASGEVGLYDTVEGQFYANAGTGTFTAGPEVVYEPDAPTNFAASVSGQTVALSWAAAANATGYRLKRDGVQIAEQTGTTYTDTVPDGTTLCAYALTAYNDDGESAAVTLLVFVQLELVTDRTRADVANQTDKGFYNASDLNRVGAAVEYIAGRFTALGYDCPVTVKKDWLTSDAPTASQMETYRQNIVTLRNQIAVMASTPEAPASMAGLNYVKANDIEQILLDLDALIDKLIKSWYFAGELYAGEV